MNLFSYVLYYGILVWTYGILTCTWNMKKPPKKIVSNYLNGASLTLTSLQILPVTVLSLERVLCPIKQGCFVQTSPTRFVASKLVKFGLVSRELPGEVTINQSNRFSLCTVRCDWWEGFRELFVFIVCRLSVSFQSSSGHRMWMYGVNWNWNDNNGGRIACRSSLVRCWCELECSFFRNKLGMFYKGNNNTWSKIEANCSNLLTRIKLLLLQDWRQHMASFGEHGAITR